MPHETLIPIYPMPAGLPYGMAPNRFQGELLDLTELDPELIKVWPAAQGYDVLTTPSNRDLVLAAIERAVHLPRSLFGSVPDLC